ncbi:elongation of very long chain fatty acids protein 4 [Aplysia californica]|uniref:Elongation of very long chain fatty acids protein n=1 Tax=Aplysia californica TaxID=6500 RepID=A0ABM0K1Q7_APLCA|nr:elongation of very long chain fatty acids protein 4 [Aplysia californica]
MESIISAVHRKYNMTDSNVFDGDPRVSEWFLMDSLGSVLTMCLLYLLMVKHGPSFMERRQPLSMTPLLVIYNFALVILSAYIFIEMLSVGIIRSYGFFCQPVNYDDTAIGIREANAAWWYFFSKVIELLDTTFFILRKKNRQVTFLHVYHHSTMMVICWYVAKYVPGGEKFYNGGFNCLVHVFMYTYYGLAAMGPGIQKYLWWKRYLTEFQLIQFLFVNIRCIGSFFNGPCEYPRWINIVALFYSSSLLLLFLNFYLKSYKAKPFALNGKDKVNGSANGGKNGLVEDIKKGN